MAKAIVKQKNDLLANLVYSSRYWMEHDFSNNGSIGEKNLETSLKIWRRRLKSGDLALDLSCLDLSCLNLEASL